MSPNNNNDEIVDALAESIVEKVITALEESEEDVAEDLQEDEDLDDVDQEDLDEEDEDEDEEDLSESESGPLMALIEGVVESKVKPLMVARNRLQTQLTEAQNVLSGLMAEKRQAEMREKLSNFTNLSDGRVLSPTIRSLVEKAVVAKPSEFEKYTLDIVKAFMSDDAFVMLGEVGSGHGNQMPAKDTAEFRTQIDKRAKEIQKTEQMSYRDAARAALAEFSK